METILYTGKVFEGVERSFVKRPIAVKALQIGTDFIVETKEGIMRGKSGDYLIQGIKGEIYPCDKTIFEETYANLNKEEEIPLINYPIITPLVKELGKITTT